MCSYDIAHLVSSLSLKDEISLELTPLSDLYFGNLIVDNGVVSRDLRCLPEMESSSIPRHCATDIVWYEQHEEAIAESYGVNKKEACDRQNVVPMIDR